MADDGDIGLSAAALQAIVDGVATKLQEAAAKTVEDKRRNLAAAGAETGAPPRADASEGKLWVVNVTPPPPYKV